VTTSVENPCGCQEVGSSNFCAEPEIESGDGCDMCEGSGSVTNPKNMIETGEWANFACQTVQEVQDILDFSPAQCADAKKAATEVCGCGGLGPAPPPSSNGPAFCFSGQTMVFVKDQGEVLMRNLRLGDEILVSDNKYERVYSFGHRHETIKTDYLQLYTSESAPLEISGDHMVIVEDGRAVPASTVQVGDKLQALAGGIAVEINTIKNVARLGAFAPFTPSGTIVVNGVVASSFVAFQDTDVLTIGNVKTPFSFQWFAHTFEAPHRFYCTYMSECLTEEYTVDGISKWVSAPLVAMKWWFAQNVTVMSLLLIPVLCVFLCLAVLNASMGNFCAMILLATALVARNQTTQKV
jgi:hypothetical protein